MKVSVDRDKLAYYVVNAADVADLIETAVGGKAVSEVFIGSKVYDVTCRFKEESRDTPEKIGDLPLVTASGSRIPLSAVADVSTVLGASSICREMSRRHLTIRVNLRGKDLSTFLGEANARIAKEVNYDHTAFDLKWDGQFENQKR